MTLAFRKTGISLVFLFFAALLAHGQGSAVDRSQLFRTEPGVQAAPTPSGEGQDLGYAAPSANDADLGVQAILKRKEEYQPFSITVSTPYYYTSNVALTRTDEFGDGVFSPSINFNYQPRLTKTLYAEFIFGQQMFYYNDYHLFNFGSFDAIAGLVYYLPQFHNLTLRARYDYNRLTSDEFVEFYHNNQVILSAETPFQFGRAMQLVVGGVINVSFEASPQGPRRNEYDAYAGFQAQLSRSFSLDLTGRVSVKPYQLGARQDVSEFISLTANYRIRDWLTLSLISSYVWNQSNSNVFEYQVYNLGGAIAATIKF